MNVYPIHSLHRTYPLCFSRNSLISKEISGICHNQRAYLNVKDEHYNIGYSKNYLLLLKICILNS